MEYKTTGLHFLIVEDNPGDYILICDYLSEVFEEVRCQRAESYEQAHYLIGHEVFDAVLLDLSLPDVSGEALLTEMEPVIKQLPVIVLTGLINASFAYRALSYGVSDYLEKEGLTPLVLFKSITYSLERYRISQKLRRSQQNYHNLFRTSPIPKWIYASDSHLILDVNDAAISHYGFSREEFLSMKTEDLCSQEANANPGCCEDGPNNGHFEHRLKNGNIISVAVQSSDVDFDGKPARMVISNDITQTLHAEKAILTSEQRFKTLVQESGDLITILDTEGNFIYVSPNHEAILGRKSAQIAEKNLLDLVHMDDVAKVRTFYEALLTENRIYSPPFRLRHINGNYLWIESIGTNAINDSAIQGLVLNSRDVTARVTHERRIQEINERLTAIAKATSDAIYSFDYDTREISLLGMNYTTLFGYKFPDDIAPNGFFRDHLHPEDRDKTMHALREAIKDKKNSHFEIEYRFRRQNGSYAYILDRFDIIREKGVPSKKVGAMQDISTRKLQETILSFEKQIYELNANPKIGFTTVINKLVSNIEDMIPDSYCTILMLNDDGTATHIAGESLGDDYPLAVNGLKIGPKAGSCGTAMYTGKKVIVTDIDNDPLWEDFTELKDRFGLKACWSVPVKKGNGKVVGSFAMYYKMPKAPHPDEINLVERVANMIGVLIENRNSFEETERAKERYDIVAKATSDTIWDWNIVDDKFEWNRGIQGVFGYKRSDVGNSSRWWFDRIHPEDSIKMSVKLYSFLEQKTEKWQDEYRFACADGSYKYVYDRAFLVKDENGKAIRMIGAMQDVTRQKQEEHRLKLMETVITQMKDSVIIAEADKSGETSPRIIFVNPSFSAMTGFRPNEIIGKSPNIFMNRKPAQRDYERLMQAIENKQEFSYETLNAHKDGEEYWVNVSLTPIWNKEAEHTHWISIQRDITEEKRQEKEKEQLIRELTQNNKDLKQFSYITSHNLRAPLSNLTGLLNLIEDMPIENPELKEILNGFHKSTHLLNETISDLVKVVIIKDNPSIQKEEVLIKDVFENVFHQLNFMIGMYKPIINLKLEKVSILNINKAYLESILLNLLTNAIKYRSPDRKLKIFVSSKIIGDSVQLVFKDNGIGIDMERNREKIFGLYQRFHNYPDSKGLGLYLVKSQVESMGGNITVDSTVDKGTSFTLTFKKQTTI
ncbi:PAS domain S-box protein [Flavobacterium selenitireducens]|uniref:PAS domain S-box protein n=1 Tax=Flavobacterium selenitireducens TaxID=2722704 RepID=UPI00168A89BB|nr:PAS domain S-box protein [Flavobacterium selenitireducens]MBD3582587.1 PAS domain S-box protein [Flavobacterium selenitireducens]